MLANDLICRQYLLDSLKCHRRLRNRAGHAREIFYRLEELRKIGEINRKRTSRHGPGDDQSRSSPQHDSGADRDHDTNHRRQQRLHLASFKSSFDCGVTCSLEMREFEVLSSKCFYGPY